jgi:chromosomal replication initiation ATPase DnaA
MGEEDREEIRRIFSGGKLPPILGDEDSVNRLKARFFEQKSHPQVPDSQFLAPPVSRIVQAICSYYRTGESELLKCKRGWFNEPRAVAIHLVRTMRKDSFADIGSAFGLRSYSAVGGVLDSIHKRLVSDRELKERRRRIREEITGQTET